MKVLLSIYRFVRFFKHSKLKFINQLNKIIFYPIREFPNPPFSFLAIISQLKRFLTLSMTRSKYLLPTKAKASAIDNLSSNEGYSSKGMFILME